MRINMDILLGRALRRLRIKKTKELSNDLSITQQHISNIERGIVGLKVSSFLAWCEALEVDPEYVLREVIKEKRYQENHTLIE